MKTDLQEIRTSLVANFQDQLPPLKIRNASFENYEVSGTIEAIQGKQKVDGYYFASVVPKPKDIRLYFFPIYTHVDEFKDISDELRKALKGKSCFHIKKMSDEMEVQIKQMVDKGVALYKRDGLI